MNKKRGVFVAGNWKMNHTASETHAFFARLGELASDSLASVGREASVRAAVFPPMLSLTSAVEASKRLTRTEHAPIEIGAQNVHWAKSGAFTGEISAAMAREAGSHLALIGHSERRQYFGETDETVRKRTEFCLSQGLDVMICIGETQAEREAGKTEAVLTRQIEALFKADSAVAPTHSPIGFAALEVNSAVRVTLAYEPVWAIGTGLTATPEQAQAAHAFIRAHLKDLLGRSEHLRLLYGGSVTPENFAGLLACPDVDGGLVGGASLKPEGFSSLLATAASLTAPTAH